MKKAIFSFLIAIFVMGGVFVPQADAQNVTIADLQAQIKALLKQVAQLQAQVTQLQGGGSPPAFCYDFGRSLRLGDVGADVTALQTALQKQGFFAGTISGNFNTETFQGAVRFQEKYQQEVLAPFGITRGTGFVGRTTNAQLNKLYGCAGRPIPSTGVVPPATAPSITVLSPNGGETISPDSYYTITWNSSGAVYSQVDIRLLAFDENGIQHGGLNYLIAAGVASNQASYSWQPTQVLSLPNFFEGAAKYKIFIGEANDSASAISDTSNNFFNIVSSTTTTSSTPSITVTSPNGGTWDGVTPVSFRAMGVERVNIDLEDWRGNPAGGPFTRRIASNIPVSFSGTYADFTFVPPVEPGSMFKIRVWDVRDANVSYAQQVADESDNFFSIVSSTTTTSSTPSITVTSPNGGTWDGVTPVSFRAMGVERVNIDLEDWRGNPAGGPFTRRIASNIPVSFSGTYADFTFVPPVEPGSMFKIRVWDVRDANVSYAQQVADESDNFFSIVSHPSVEPSITVLFPNGGESFGATDGISVKWESQNIPASTQITVDFVKGSSVAKRYITTNNGILDIEALLGLSAGSDYKVRVYSLDTQDYSDNFFSIVKLPPCGNFGDVNNDGFVDMKDTELILQFTIGLPVLVTAEEQKRADVNADGEINIIDNITVVQYVTGLIDTFPVCSSS